MVDVWFLDSDDIIVARVRRMEKVVLGCNRSVNILLPYSELREVSAGIRVATGVRVAGCVVIVDVFRHVGSSVRERGSASAGAV